MPNNPYSPEAIKKRLSAKSTSSLFDSITSKKDIDEDKVISSQNNSKIVKKEDSANDVDGTPKLNSSISTDNVAIDDRRSMSPSPKVLKDVLLEEIPQYKRYIFILINYMAAYLF